MADDSTFVIRWEMDDAAKKCAARKAESGVFNEGGFQWIAGVERFGESTGDTIGFSMRCDVHNSRIWKCEGELAITLCHSVGATPLGIKDRFCLNANSGPWLHSSLYHWILFTSPPFYIDDKITLEFHIRIISSESSPLIDNSNFSSPNEASNVTLVIGDKTLNVSKDYLAVHSPVFAAMFFGAFDEKGKEEVEIKDVVYEEFLDLLNVIYVEEVDITDRSVGHILKLADQFQMARVRNLSKKHLMQSKGFDAAKKLQLADQYRLTALRDQCLNSFTTLADLTKNLNLSPEYANFSECTKSAICDRVMKLSL